MKPILEPIEPTDAVDLYLMEKKSEVSQWTHYSHGSRLGHFLRWCAEQGVDNLNDITGRDLKRYKLWRRDDGDINNVTLKTQMDTLRVFIRWCESIDAVSPDLSTKVESPDLDYDDNVRTVMLDSEDGEEVLAYLRKYKYCSLPHVVFELLWHTSLRRGAAVALDVDDYDPQTQQLNVRHRPDTGTPIKNKARGERTIALQGSVCQILDDWIATGRPKTTDDFGREPLLATNQGRAHGQTIQRYVYTYTRPCVYAGDCPIDRNIKTCEAAEAANQASKCPESVSPHAVRRGSITNYLKKEVPKPVLSDRANVSIDVLDMHYNEMTESEKAEQRRQFFE
ncbi:integrase domain-containing protein SAM domain-containing protein [Halorubrum aidingense JCM 13560]|uniref:Integrase domain-containing protein SAM domain-containing protein n=1 Tax=Halorubrum aidingense JCM 13560 TaxID=1230454 RepID=M0PFB0_9EURY|nr:site-specific integrase [Halorubrum aidingense]EMA68807.1 integrase domain-containing protein SAM domain-containing protein [Halorubrum aidingense JCM 13560]